MKIDILTLFPEMIDGFINSSIIKRAKEKGLVEINLVNFRDYSPLKNRQVDDTPFGGGAGMVLRPEPIFNAIKALKTPEAKVILLTPDGFTYKQSFAKNLAIEKHLIFICGHYEGFDERIRTLVDLELSIGDYILTGGELPACVIMDSIIRLVKGVINQDSLEEESFNNNLLDYPTWTKPREYENLTVPEVLVNGNHKEINAFREAMRLKKTEKRRPDLLKGGKSEEFFNSKRD